MAQQFLDGENLKPIKTAGKIRPKEPTTVYVTEKLAKSSSNSYTVGQKVDNLHRVTAQRWVDAGKATFEDPNAESIKDKGGKK